MENQEIINRVAQSGLVTFDLETLYRPGEREFIDLGEQLHEGLILREKDFRTFVQSHDWSGYQGKYVAVGCTADAIIPVWAFMLLAASLEPYAARVVYGSLDDLERILFYDQLAAVNWEEFRDRKVVVKGCSKVPVPTDAYIEAVNRLRPVAASLFFGEACSTVPLYKRPRR